MTTLTAPTVADLVNEVGSLPSAAARIVGLAIDPDCGLDDLTRALGTDPAMAARLLALANSASIARGRSVKDLREAVVRLGLKRVRNVALLMAAHDMQPAAIALPGLDACELWRFNLATAAAAAALAPAVGAHPDDAWLVGLLDGLGLTVLMRREPEAVAHAVALARREACPLAPALRRILGFDQQDVTSRLLAEWSLPRSLLDSLDLAHGRPCAAGGVDSAALAAVLPRARGLVRAAGCGACGDGDAPPTVDQAAAAAGLSPEDLDAAARRIDDEMETAGRFLDENSGADGFAATLAAARLELARIGIAGLDEALAREELEEDLAAARAVQQRLAAGASAPVAGWLIGARNTAARHVSGDCWDVVPLARGATGIFVADACGKGLPAALLAASLHATIRALGTVTADPGRLLTAANMALAAVTDDERFATCVLMVPAPDGRSLDYASAGHPPLLLVPPTGEPLWLQGGGLPLGLMPGTAYATRRVEMQGHPLIVAVTDGVLEAGPEPADGRESFAAAARALAGDDVDVVAGSLADATDPPDAAAAADDRTIVVLRPAR